MDGIPGVPGPRGPKVKRTEKYLNSEAKYLHLGLYILEAVLLAKMTALMNSH